jgi:hypothetical protein
VTNDRVTPGHSPYCDGERDRHNRRQAFRDGRHGQADARQRSVGKREAAH